MRHPLFAALVLAAFALGGCEKSQPPASVAVTSSVPYTLDDGDRLRIDVFGQANLSKQYLVDGNGTISMPLIGLIGVRGMTASQLELALERRLGAKYLRNPNVTVEVQQPRPFFVLGEVTRSGQYAYVSGMTVQTAIAISGGFSPRANRRKVRVTRRMDRKLVEFSAPLTYQIRPGDTIYVKERFF
ncbi:MAG: sugar transporter [Hyphomicrobiales bacterium]|nr:MAG: sugar transporter [Hyphomicrobiales bacterium]